MSSPGRAMAAPRDIAFDILKGVGIAEVLLHHTLSFSARKFSASGSAEWWSLMLSNRILHFAIPTFLLASALLLARSLSKHEKPDYGRYFNRRVVRSLWPFLIWSVTYLFFRAYVVEVGADTVPYTLQLPWGGSITGPTVLLDPNELRHDALWGKAYFHLYFLSVLLQLSLMLPLVLLLMRKVRMSFGGVALLAGAVQIGVYLLQANVLRSPHPASMAIWYMPAILMGTWLGMNWNLWEGIWKRTRRLLGAIAFASGVTYLGFSITTLAGYPLSNLAYNASFSLYGTSVALFLLGWAGNAEASRRPIRALAALGAVSLPMFVLHPMLLYFFGGPRISSVLNQVPLAPLFIWGALLLLTLGFAKLLIFLRLDGLLFGRSYRKELAPAKPILAPAGAGMS